MSSVASSPRTVTSASVSQAGPLQIVARRRPPFRSTRISNGRVPPSRSSTVRQRPSSGAGACAAWSKRARARSRLIGSIARWPAGRRLAPVVALARRDRDRQRVPAPRSGAGIDGVVGAERVPGPVEVEQVPAAGEWAERDEAPGGVAAAVRGGVAEVDLEVGFVLGRAAEVDLEV